MANSLTIAGIDAGYGAVRVLDGVSLTVGAGETVALLGTNGNGKSTLMKSIMGMVRPSAGKITATIDGTSHELIGRSTEEIVDLGIGFVPEGRRLFPKLTVTENLLLGAFRPKARSQIKRNLDFCLETFPRLKERTSQLAGTLNAVEARLNERVRWISATPAIAPVKGIFTSGFGVRADPMTHGRGDHQGVDIAAAPGQPVRASADGVVIRAAEIGGLGQAVFIAHGFGVTTRYGHMSRIEVRPGQRVKRGDIVGRVGNTGRSTGYHLHYEVRVDGDPVNPLAYILDDTAAGAS